VRLLTDESQTWAHASYSRARARAETSPLRLRCSKARALAANTSLPDGSGPQWRKCPLDASATTLCVAPYQRCERLDKLRISVSPAASMRAPMALRQLGEIDDFTVHAPRSESTVAPCASTPPASHAQWRDPRRRDERNSISALHPRSAVLST